MSVQTNIKPGNSSFKKFVVKAGFLALGRALQSASNFEPEIMNELEAWPENFSFSMNVLPHGPNLTMIKKNGKLNFASKYLKDKANLISEIKNVDTAFRMITTQAGVHKVYAEHKIGVIGNVPDSMILIRLIYTIQGYLFPAFLCKKILKKPFEMNAKKHLYRLRLYTLGMISGK